MRRHTLAPLVLAAVIAAACGTTVPLAERQQVASSDELGGLSSSGGVLPPGAHVNKKGQVVSSSGEVLGSAEDFGLSSGGIGGGTASGGSTGGSTTTGGVGGAGGGGGTTSAALGPGITDEKIFVAVAQIDAGPANEQVTGQSLSADAHQPYNAMIQEVNKAGGIQGREVEPLYYRFEGASSQTIDQQSQAACAHWTEDNEVFAFFWSDANGVLQECAKKEGAIVPLPDPFFSALPEDFQRYPNLYEVSGLDVVRAGEVTVAGLDRQRYFSKDPKLGIVLWDDPKYVAALERGFVPALKSAGIELATEPAQITPPQTLQDLGATSADINSAVLRFQSQGITHVMLLDGPAGLCGGGCMGTLFMRRAEQQGFRPRYGFNTNNIPKDGLAQGLYPAEQLSGSVAVEWADWDETYDAGWHLNRARETCFDLMRKHGVPLENINQRLLARTACEQLWFMLATVQKMGNATLNAANFTAGVNTIGSSFQDPSAYAITLSAKHHDGVAAARNMKFDDSCGCYKWTTDPYQV
jgi:hypothetical protein